MIYILLLVVSIWPHDNLDKRSKHREELFKLESWRETGIYIHIKNYKGESIYIELVVLTTPYQIFVFVRTIHNHTVRDTAMFFNGVTVKAMVPASFSPIR